MKILLIASTIFFASQANAEIFKCKDGKGKIAYQETPCQTKTVGKISNVPDASLEDQASAHARGNQDKYMVRQREAAEEARRQQGEAARRQYADDRRNVALEQEAEQKLKEEKKAEAREKRRSKHMHCTPDYAGGMNCITN